MPAALGLPGLLLLPAQAGESRLPGDDAVDGRPHPGGTDGWGADDAGGEGPSGWL